MNPNHTERHELTSSQVLEQLSELLGTGADPSEHAGAEIIISGPDSNPTVLALSRDFRADVDGVWMRPLSNPPEDHNRPYFIEQGNEALCLKANGNVEVTQNPSRILLTEAGHEHFGVAPKIEIRTATGQAAETVSIWDWFTLSLTTSDSDILAACTPELEQWPNNPFTSDQQTTKL